MATAAKAAAAAKEDLSGITSATDVAKILQMVMLWVDIKNIVENQNMHKVNVIYIGKNVNFH